MQDRSLFPGGSTNTPLLPSSKNTLGSYKDAFEIFARILKDDNLILAVEAPGCHAMFSALFAYHKNRINPKGETDRRVRRVERANMNSLVHARAARFDG